MKQHLLVLLVAISASARGQSSGQVPPLIVGKAQLLNTLKSANLKPGDLFYLRTTGPWHQGDCTIPSHTTVTGVVESLTSPTAQVHGTIVTVRFAQIACLGSTSTFMTPLLVSIKAPDPGRNDVYNSGAPETPMLAGIFPSEVNRSAVISKAASGTNNLTRALDADDLNQLRNVPGSERPMHTGEVRGYRGVALTLPGREGPAARLSSDHKIVLDRDSEFALAYAPAPPQPVSSESRPVTPSATPVGAANANVAPAIPATPPPPEIEDVCASAGCRQLAVVPETSSARAVWSLPLAGLDYQPRPQQPITGLDHSASVHFLSEDQILLTFTRHVLVPRPSDSDAWASNPRSVRAVLISRADGRVLRVTDWTVSDDLGPFVWSLGNGSVVAHVGHDLVRFGAGLVIEQRVRLSGPLLFLSPSPNGDLLLLATVREKHTREEHAEIAAFVGPGVPIDEEYDLTGLNAAFQVTGVRRVTVTPLRPALLQSSMVSARPTHGSDWLLEESTWEGRSKRFAHFRSICPVQVQSFPGDLLFVQGCTPVEANSTWYRVLNAQGATLFKGSGPRSDFIQQAESTDDGRLFAIASSHFNRPVDRTTTLQAGDFNNVVVNVYDTATGKQVFAAHPQQGSAEEDTFSLSPSASSIAVLTSGALQLFSLRAPGAKR